MQASAFIAVSLDGYIARLDHAIDWLESSDSDPNEDYGYGNFIKSVTSVVMGRKTFETISSFPEWPYHHQRSIVLTTTLEKVPESISDEIQLFNGNVEDLTELLETESEKRLYIDGSQAIQAFIKAGLLSDITITTLPILIGKGIPLFNSPLDHDVHLTHLETRAFQNGFVQTTYLINSP